LIYMVQEPGNSKGLWDIGQQRVYTNSGEKMKSKNNLSKKIISGLLLTLILAFGLSGFFISYLANRDFKKNAILKIQGTRANLINHASEMESNLLRNAKKLAEMNEIIAPVNMISRYSSKKDYQAIIFDPEKKKLARELQKRASGHNHGLVAVYDGFGTLISFYFTNWTGERTGIVSFDNGEPVFLLSGIPDFETWTGYPMPNVFEGQMDAPVPKINQGTFLIHYNRLALEVCVPVQKKYTNGKIETVGFIRVLNFLDQDFMSYMGAKTDTACLLFINNKKSIGTIKDLAFPDSFSHPASLFEDKIIGERLIEYENHFFDVRFFPVNDGRRVFFAFGLEKNVLDKELFRTKAVVLGAIFLSLLLVIPVGLIFLNRVVSQPMEKLVVGAKTIQQGIYDQPINYESSDDLGQLARAFNEMSLSIKQREEDLQGQGKQLLSLNKELVQHRHNLLNMVEERTKELEKTNIALKKSRIAAEEASQTKSEFLATMSHELRTPLNAIIGFSEILAQKTFGELNTRQEKYVKNVLTSGQHLLSLINDILDISKVEAGKMELELSTIFIKTLVETSLMMIKEKAMKNGIKLDLKVEKKLSTLSVEADARKLKQIMFNLLSNAVKFTPKGGSVCVLARIENGQCIKVSVTDSGIGIAPENQARAFGEFEQIDSSHARLQQGTGLGLALTRKFVELHGGRIWVESEGEGKGSSFVFIIPLGIEY
jgi:signal transduction histidine kinase